VDLLVFYAVLRLLEYIPVCPGCFIQSNIHLDPGTAIILAGLLFLTVASVGLYNEGLSHSFGNAAKQFLFTWQLLLVSFGLTFALTKIASGFPFSWRAAALAGGLAAFVMVLFALRALVTWCMDLPFMKKRILVLGAGPGAEALGEFLRGPGHRHFVQVQSDPSWQLAENAMPQIGNVVLALPLSEPGSLLRFAQLLRVDEIVVVADDRREFPAAELIDCKLQGISVVDALTFWEREAGVIEASQVAPEWLAFASGFPSNQPHRILKRAVDLVISASFLLLFLPLCVLVALAIKLESPGPVFYRQERVGLNGRVFRLWKFRSMRADAEKDGTPQWAASVDSRVTRVGRVIRLLRIDEIPQIINVLSGDMSFIGPRPERPFFVEQLRELLPNYDLRHRVRPGITGWAQVNYPYGASVEDARRKLAYDLFYLKKNDVLLDLAILMQTVRVVLFAQGAR
jgi:sugar transferase (PEP-CTERM system associated)